jgi:large subunit ribosomal protein L4e
MAARAQVTVFSSEDGTKKSSSAALPAVFSAPIRPDIVNFVHTNMRKNKRQPYAVSEAAGHQTSAISWGTGRAVSRIPRISGGGTGRSGQGAYGNMCRKGRMFAPTKVWRRWHKKINQNQRRYSTASAIAASALPALVEARGHRVGKIAEIPVVVDDGIQSFKKTKDAVRLLKQLGLFDDVTKSKDSRKVRSGLGKLRNRRHVQRRGPLVIYDKDEGVSRAFRNLPGVNVARVEALNLLQLAPGGHLGRLVLWSQSAFKKLDALFGSQTEASSLKKNYHLPRPVVALPDLARLIKSNEIKSALKPRKTTPATPAKVNPLNNLQALLKLNPYAATYKRLSYLQAQQNLAKKTGAAAKSTKVLNKKKAAKKAAKPAAAKPKSK